MVGDDNNGWRRRKRLLNTSWAAAITLFYDHIYTCAEFSNNLLTLLSHSGEELWNSHSNTVP